MTVCAYASAELGVVSVREEEHTAVPCASCSSADSGRSKAAEDVLTGPGDKAAREPLLGPWERSERWGSKT